MPRFDDDDRKTSQHPEEWREMRDFQSRSNYHYDGRLTPDYVEPNYTALGIVLLVIAATSAAALIVFAPYGEFAAKGFFRFVVDSYSGLLFSAAVLWAGIRMVRKRHGREHADEVVPAPKTTATSTPPAGAASRALPRSSVVLRFFAVPLIVLYFLPFYLFIQSYGLSAVGMTTGQYDPFKLFGPWYLGFLLILPVALYLFAWIRPLARFQHVAAVVVAVLDLYLLHVFQTVVDGFGIAAADLTRDYAYYATLVLDVLLLAYVLVRAIVRLARRGR